MRKSIGFCIPCYNEERNIVPLYNKIKQVMDNLPYEYTILFIDNHSTDNSSMILKRLSENNLNVITIFNEKNYGPSRSGAYAFYNTKGDAVITMACDLQDPPELINDFILKWEEGYKLVLGKKINSEEKKSMFLIRKLYYKIINIFIKDDGLSQITGFGLYDRKIIEIMKSVPQPNPNFRFLISELGFQRTFIEYTQPKRASGHSSYTFFSYLDLAINSLVSNSKKPIRLVSYIGVLTSIFFFCITFIYLIYSLYSFTLNIYILLFLILLFLSSIIIMAIGGIGEYIAVILDYQKKIPYVVERERINE